MSDKDFRIQKHKIIQNSCTKFPILKKFKSSFDYGPKDTNINHQSSSNLLKLHTRNKSTQLNHQPFSKQKPPYKLKPLLKAVSFPLTSLEKDKFYFKNALRSHLTEFQDLLEFVPDVNSAYFYMFRVNRTIPEPKMQNSKVQIEKRVCSCPVEDKKLSLVRHYNKIWPQTPKESASKLKKIYLKFRETKFPEKIVIINVEGVLLQTGRIRPRLISSLTKLQKYYQLVLVKSSDIRNFLLFLANEGIRFSGIYEKLALSEVVVDYSEIFTDFNITQPSSDSIIISTINSPLEDLEDRSGEKLIVFKHGLTTHILVKNPPLPFSDESTNPCTLIVPMLNKDEQSLPMTPIASLIKSLRNCAFDHILKLRNIEAVSSSVVTQFLIEQKFTLNVDQMRSLLDCYSAHKCDVHNSPADSSRELPVLHFGVLKTSFFPSTFTFF